MLFGESKYTQKRSETHDTQPSERVRYGWLWFSPRDSLVLSDTSFYWNPYFSTPSLRNKVSKEEEAAMAKVNREGGQQKFGAMLLIRGQQWFDRRFLGVE
jgi:hypothetical protein